MAAIGRPGDGLRFPVDEVLEGLSAKRSSAGHAFHCPKNPADDGKPDWLIAGREVGQMGWRRP